MSERTKTRCLEGGDASLVRSGTASPEVRQSMCDIAMIEIIFCRGSCARVYRVQKKQILVVNWATAVWQEGCWYLYVVTIVSPSNLINELSADSSRGMSESCYPRLPNEEGNIVVTMGNLT